MSATAELTDPRAVGSARLFDDVTSAPRGVRAGDGPLRLDGEGGESTLDELLAGVWERLTVHAVANCPVCDGRLTAQRQGAVASGHCRDCSSALS